MATWSGLWDGVHGAPYAQIGARTDIQRELAMIFERRGGRDLSALAIALNGVAPGAVAASTFKRVTAEAATTSFNLGGVRAIETATIINRATTAADQTLLTSIYDGVFAPTTYPVDKGGGGGGKLGTLM